MHKNQLFSLNGTKHIGNNKSEVCLIHAIDCIKDKYFIFLLILTANNTKNNEFQYMLHFQ